MKTEAASTGFYHSPGWGKEYPKVQILTVEELPEGYKVKMPPAVHTATTFRQAEKVKAEPPQKQQGWERFSG